ncbi:MAG: polysaccharide pyruvyl transferase family protein, partial [Cyclonatronaceae bacterium]
MITKKFSGEIPLFWYSMPILHGHEKENFGDILSKYIVEKISGKNVFHENPINSKWYKPDKKIYFAIGSILHIATKKTIVWGSGMIQRKDKIKRAMFLAVRGPVTRQLLISQGHKVPP